MILLCKQQKINKKGSTLFLFYEKIVIWYDKNRKILENFFLERIMKKLILFIVIIFTIGFITNNTAKSAERPYYILFDNLEDQMGNGEGPNPPYDDANTKISNLIDLYYWDPLTSREAWQPYC